MVLLYVVLYFLSSELLLLLMLRNDRIWYKYNESLSPEYKDRSKLCILLGLYLRLRSIEGGLEYFMNLSILSHVHYSLVVDMRI